MRLATFNILHGRAVDDGRVDLVRFQAAIARLDADILALQEVDLGLARSGGADLTGLAAEAMGAVEHRFVPALAGTPGGDWREPLDPARPEGPAYGVALLSRLPVRRWSALRLPTVPTRAPVWSRGHRPRLVREEPRVAVLAELEAPRGPVTVVNTHLSFVPWWSGHQLRTLVRALHRCTPVLVVGDLNLEPARARRLTGLRSLARVDTFPADAPSRQLDHVLAGGEFTVRGIEQHRLPLSDHRALVVDLC